ncbi:MAG: hypothetical protein R6V62_02760 [Candidatus Fermentibacteraceae bacterium]
MMTMLLVLAVYLTPVLVVEDVVSVVPLDRATVLLIDGEGAGYTLNLDTGLTIPWSPSWSPGEDGWEDDGYIFATELSPDGNHLLILQGVYAPDRYGFPEGYDVMRSAILVILSRPDGSGATPVAVSVAAGSGPDYAFTTDSRFIVGGPMFNCEPTPDAYSALLRSDSGSFTMEPVNRITVSTGERSFIADLDISDGFWKCPYSDWMRLENNWYAEHTFSNLVTGGVAGFFRVPGGEAWVHGWVLEDALLITTRTGQGILHVDGSFIPCPSGTWDVLSWLPDGRFIYDRNESGRLVLGEVDWETFSAEPGGVPVRIPEEIRHVTAKPMPAIPCTGILFHDRWGSGNLWFLRTAD